MSVGRWRLPPEHAQGLGRDETINLFFQRALAQCPDKPAIVSYRAGREEPIILNSTIVMLDVWDPKGALRVIHDEDLGFSFEDMTAYLTEQQLTRTYFPGRLEVLEQMPQTPSGKLQKFKLSEMAKQFGESAPG